MKTSDQGYVILEMSGHNGFLFELRKYDTHHSIALHLEDGWLDFFETSDREKATTIYQAIIGNQE